MFISLIPDQFGFTPYRVALWHSFARAISGSYEAGVIIDRFLDSRKPVRVETT